MLLAAMLLLLFAGSLSAQAGAIPSIPLAVACTDAASCSYNGACTASGCVCNPQWRGAVCATLAVLPASKLAGFHSPHVPGPAVNTSSWGGSILLDEATSTWHMYSAEMINDWCVLYHLALPCSYYCASCRGGVLSNRSLCCAALAWRLLS
jgi:hypothetical protein